ncbi:MAG TPA: dihydrofolate reductase family protein [Polyangia bacterium]|jgi:dihydrofolate reductase
MRKLSVFNQVSIDGYFRTADGDIGWVKAPQGDDPEFKGFISGNASGDGVLLFGRKTYEMMASFWPTAAAAAQFPEVARGMARAAKVVFSRTMKDAAWSNTTVVNGDPVEEVGRLKQAPGAPLVILGSGSLVAPLARAGLIDEYQLLVFPVVLGAGVGMFAGVGRSIELKLTSTRTFKNGITLLVYAPR